MVGYHCHFLSEIHRPFVLYAITLFDAKGSEYQAGSTLLYHCMAIANLLLFRTKLDGSDYELASIPFHRSRGMVGRRKGNIKR